MYRNALQIGLLACALVASTGCHGLMCNRFEPMVHDGHWDPVLGSCDSCGSCGGVCDGHTPCSYAKHTLTCASGAGEIYWGEWNNDPPAPCDPCDDCGNFVGPRCCPPTFWECIAGGWCNFWGHRMDGCGCGTCGVEGGVLDYGMPTEGMSITEGVLKSPLPFDAQEHAPHAKSEGEIIPPPGPIPDRQATLQPPSGPLWRARRISFQSARFPRSPHRRPQAE